MNDETMVVLTWAWDRGWTAGYVVGQQVAQAEVAKLMDELREIREYAESLEARVLD